MTSGPGKAPGPECIHPAFRGSLSMSTRFPHLRRLLATVAGLAVLLLAGSALGRDEPKERDLYDLEGQKKAPNVRKIVFVADTAPHGGRGNHEFLADAIYLARTINARYPNAWAVVTTKDKWPRDL